MSTSQVLRRSLSICRNDNKPVRLAASNNHRYPEGSDGDAVYLEPLIARLTEAGDAPVLRHEDRDTTAADLLKSVYRYARALAAIGIKRGSLITLFAPNRPDALAVRYAANLLGAATYYLSAPSDPRHRADLLAQTDPELLVLFPETAHLLPAGLGVPIAAIGTNLDGASLRLDEAAASQSSTPVASLARPDDLAVVISSGGTTGVPKGSCRDFTSYTAMVNVPSPAGRRQLVNGPLANISQLLVDVTLLGGGLVVLADSNDPEDTLSTIESERITDLLLVEPQLFEVMDHADIVRRDLSDKIAPLPEPITSAPSRDLWLQAGNLINLSHILVGTFLTNSAINVYPVSGNRLRAHTNGEIRSLGLQTASRNASLQSVTKCIERRARDIET